MFEVKMDFAEMDALRDRISLLRPKIVTEVSRQALYFISDIQKNQMSGRRGDIYLNVDTGNLRRSWFSQTKMDEDGISTRVYSNVPYARIHQKGGTIQRPARQQIISFQRPSTRRRKDGPMRRGFVSPSQAHFQQKVNVKPGEIRIPKRLFVEEEFHRQMPDRYKKAVIKAIHEVLNGR